jgi:hypothetical protein
MEITEKQNRNTTRHKETDVVAEKGGGATIWRSHAPLRGVNALGHRGHLRASEIHAPTVVTRWRLGDERREAGRSWSTVVGRV